MRRVFAVLLALVLPLTACTGGQTIDTTPPDPLDGSGIVGLGVSLDQAIIADGDGEAVAMISVTADTAPDARAPVHMAVVMDTSGSMEGAKIENARMAAHGLVDRLDDGDTLTLVTYSDAGQIVLDGWEAGDDRSEAHEAIDAIEPDGQTCTSCGMQMAYDLLYRGDPTALRRVVLISDGHANRGTVDPGQLAQIAAQFRNAYGIDTSTIGLGRLHNEATLASIADAGSADYYFLASAGDLDDLLEREIADLHETAVADLLVRVQPGDGVSLGTVQHAGIRYEGYDLVIPIGQLAVGEERQYLIPLALPPGDMGRAVRVEATFADVEGTLYAVQSDARVIRSEDAQAVEDSTNAVVLKEYGLLLAALETERAMDAVEAGDTEAALNILEANQRQLEEWGAAYDDELLYEEAQMMQDLSAVIETSAAPMNSAGTGGGSASSDAVRGNVLNQRARSRERRRGVPAAAPSWHEPSVEAYEDMD